MNDFLNVATFVAILVALSLVWYGFQTTLTPPSGNSSPAPKDLDFSNSLIVENPEEEAAIFINGALSVQTHRYTFRLKGYAYACETHPGSGISRQHVICRLRIHQQVYLVHCPDNKYDPDAIAVCVVDVNGVQYDLGHIAKASTDSFHRSIAEKHSWISRLEAIEESPKGFKIPVIGVNFARPVRLNKNGKPRATEHLAIELLAKQAALKDKAAATV